MHFSFSDKALVAVLLSALAENLVTVFADDVQPIRHKDYPFPGPPGLADHRHSGFSGSARLSQPGFCKLFTDWSLCCMYQPHPATGHLYDYPGGNTDNACCVGLTSVIFMHILP